MTALLRQLFAWPRLRVALGVSLIPFVLLLWQWTSGPQSLIVRTTALGLMGLLAYGVFERWPRRLPGWLARWVLQLAAIGAVMPVTMLFFYWWATKPGAPAFWTDPVRMEGFVGLSAIGMFFGWWTGLFALVRQKDGLVRSQAVALERQAAESRMQLLQQQIQPHFLFNTLANIRELVQSGSPQAPAVLDSLIAYLRAAVPRLHEPLTTLGQELELVRAYLELMHMRMPDRLQFGFEVDAGAERLRCPPMTLLTLVENAVRHGIDPAEDGGRIDVRVKLDRGRCEAQVCDTGVGLRSPGGSLGTGLAALRERLQLVFGSDATLSLAPQQPRGACANLSFPVTR